MKKFLCVLVLMFLFGGLAVEALTIQGGVVYTVESAREEAFRGILYKIDIENYRDVLVDPGFIAPGNGKKKPKVSKRGRSVCFFSDGGYATTYYDERNRTYGYSANGELETIEFVEFSTYPAISKTYDIKGNLKEVSFWVSGEETFIYDTNKNLLEHWKGKKGYDSIGNIIGERYY